MGINRLNIRKLCLILLFFYSSLGWGGETVLWLVLEQNGTQQWINNDHRSPFAHQMESLTKETKLSLLLPLYDLIDTSVISEKDVVDKNIEILQKASLRYGADCLSGVFRYENETWQGRWLLLKGGKSQAWDTEGPDFVLMMKEVLAKLDPSKNEALVGRGTIPLTVSGVLNEKHYIQVIDYLRALPYVAQVEVAEISPNRTIFHLLTTVSQDELRKSIALGHVLKQTEDPELTYKMVERL